MQPVDPDVIWAVVIDILLNAHNSSCVHRKVSYTRPPGRAEVLGGCTSKIHSFRTYKAQEETQVVRTNDVVSSSFTAP